VSDGETLRDATLRILEHHGPIDTGSLVTQLQAHGHTQLRALWALLDQLRAEGAAVSSGPPARQCWSRGGPAGAPPQPAPRPAPEPELDDPALFLAVGPADELDDPATFLVASHADSGPPPARPRRGRPRGAARTTRYKSLTRCDYVDHQMVGYMVRVVWKGERRQAFFSDHKYGDRLGALAAALAWRDQMERELGKPRSEAPLGNNAPPSNTGVFGVSRMLRAGLPSLQVTWYEGGRLRRTSISISKYGEAEAMRMARALRARDERPNGGRPTTTTKKLR